MAKCTNKPEKSPEDYFFLQNAGLSTTNFKLEVLNHFKFCKNCYDYIKSHSENQFFYDYKEKKKTNKKIQ